METESQLWRYLWIMGAALAGAISALPSMRWREMDVWERTLTIFVGGAFAVFLTPLVVERFVEKPGLQTVCAFTYIMGICGNAIVPVLIERGRIIARSWGPKADSGKDTL